MKTCGSCKWWRVFEEDLNYGSCMAPEPKWIEGSFGNPAIHANQENDCPVFDDGSFDKAVEELIAVILEVEYGTDRKRRVNEAIAAVRKAREERGK